MKFDIFKMSRYLDKTLEPMYHIYRDHDGDGYYIAYHSGHKSRYILLDTKFYCVVKRLLKRYLKLCGDTAKGERVYIGGVPIMKRHRIGDRFESFREFIFGERTK